MVRAFFHWKCKNKVLLGFYFIKTTKTRYGWGFD